MTAESLDQESPSAHAFICTDPIFLYHNPRFCKSSKSMDFRIQKKVLSEILLQDVTRYSKKQDVKNGV